MFIAKRIQAVTLFLVLTTLLLSQTGLSAPKSYRIELPTRTIEASADNGAWLAQRSVDEATAVLLQFNDHPDAFDKRALGLAGVQLQEYVGGGAWVAYIPAGIDPAVFDRQDIRWAGPILESDKIDLRVAASEIPSWADTPDGILYAVAMMKNVPESEAEVLLRQAGAIPGAQITALHTWYVLGDEDLPGRLAKDPRVHFITYISPPLESLNAGIREVTNVDIVYDPPYNLTGAGETVCVYDGGLVFAHADFEDRLQLGEGGATATHPTHVAGTVGGNGGLPYRGMAPEVSIISYQYEGCDPYCLYDSPQDIYENYEGAFVSGARIMTNSIGANVGPNGYDCSWLGDYELVSALIDSLVRGPFGEPLIVTWAAGNERGAGCPGSFETMSVPSGAKNSIVVGATNDNDGMTSFSSWGPTDDGRIKPDVCAPGENISSCSDNGGYTTMSGTSMATPAVAGITALLLQSWHQTINSETNPLPETVKAIFCNSAEDLGNVGPDYKFGWGRVDALAAVETIQNWGFNEGVIDDDENQSVTFDVPVGLDELMVTISWSDAPAGYLPLIALVNDLDLIVSDPTGFEYSPFVMDPANPGSPATNGVNTLDNVEQVRVLNPVPGEWTLTVDGSDVPAGPQTYGIAANVPLVDGLTSISGTVMDADTDAPIENAQLRLFLPSGDVVVASGENGGFLMYAQLTEDAMMEITASGYQTQHAWVIEDGDGSAVLFIEMHPGGTANVTGTVYIPGGGSPWPNLTVFVVEIPTITGTSDIDGLYELNGLPANELLTIRVEESGLSDQQVVFLEPDETAIVELEPYDPSEDTVGPDQYGYLAVQDTDTHPMAPIYEWVAIDPLEGGLGIRVELPNEETPVVIGLPFEFAYYDSVYTNITANENGFFSFGDRSYMDPAEAADFSNSPLPNSDGPPATVAPFWEDFRAAETNLSYYDDALEGRFIIEWYDSRQWPDPSTRETFQVILYDQQAFPEHGDWGHLLFQYADVNDLSEAAIGIEDETETMGITITNDGTYHPNASTVDDESAIYFYRPVADLEGTVALDPADPQAEVTITVGDFSIQAMGEFLFEDLFPGFAVVDFELEGYESRMIAVELPEGGLLTIPPVTLTRLDVPIDVYYEELNGNFENGASVYWTEPSMDGEIDEFLGLYRVYKNGIMIGETADLTLADDAPYIPDTGYWVTAMYAGGESDSSLHATYQLEVGEHLSLLPTEFEVAPPWPNPFNPSTAIRIALPEQAKLTVAVYDLLGRQVTRLVSDEIRKAGYHQLVWDATGHASGVYFVRVKAGPNSSVKKVMLLK